MGVLPSSLLEKEVAKDNSLAVCNHKLTALFN